MKNAPALLETLTLFPPLVSGDPLPDTGIILVVPAFDEPDITNLLDSLKRCIPPECNTELIIIINAPAGASQESLENNLIAKKNITLWSELNKDAFFRLFIADLGQPDMKDWGVGLARKAGMDEAARRFLLINNEEGIIATTDADCTVEINYFTELEENFLKQKGRRGCSVYFEHPLECQSFSEKILDAVYQYELHLRYYYQALKYSGYPNVFHTVGSAMAVRCSAYIKAGGMNRRQAGEDFYFIQKLISGGSYFYLSTTKVLPSPRVSDRVPFGTGPVVKKLIADDEIIFYTYNPASFTDLKMLFEKADVLYGCGQTELSSLYFRFPESIRIFLEEINWLEKLEEIRSNTAGQASFRKRFFDWFNMFRIIKFLNFAHSNIYNKVSVQHAAEEMLELKGLADCEFKGKTLLEFYRKLERGV